MTVQHNLPTTTAGPPSTAVDAAAVWGSLSEVEKTCLQVAFVRWSESHRTWPDGKPWYEDPWGSLWVDACVPEDQQAKMRKWKEEGDRIADVMAVRTAEIDAHIRVAAWGTTSDAPTSNPSPSHGGPTPARVSQLVIVGAGADMRAWRLSWPPGFKLFEVDSDIVLRFKARVLEAAGPVFAQHLTVHRAEVVADAAQPEEMVAKLHAAGLAPDLPVFWLLEGLLGYLPQSQGDQLLATLYTSSPPGSTILVTVPPGPAVKAARDQARAAAAAATAAVGTSDSAKRDTDSVDDAEPVVHMGEGAAGGVSTVQANMPHVTFEEPEDTFARVVGGGWTNVQLLNYEWLANKYGVSHAQPIVIGHKDG